MFRHMRETMAALPTLTAGEAKQAGADLSRRFRSGNAPSGKTSGSSAERARLEPPAGLNRAQRRILPRQLE